VVGILQSVFAPESAIDGVPPDQLALALEQHDEQLHRYALELEGMARAAELIALDVQIKLSKADWRGHVLTLLLDGIRWRLIFGKSTFPAVDRQLEFAAYQR
jgi:hypothetical protein